MTSDSGRQVWLVRFAFAPSGGLVASAVADPSQRHPGQRVGRRNWSIDLRREDLAGLALNMQILTCCRALEDTLLLELDAEDLAVELASLEPEDG